MNLKHLETGKMILDLILHPNVQYEYRVKEAGTYKFCVMLEDFVFDKYQKVKS